MDYKGIDLAKLPRNRTWPISNTQDDRALYSHFPLSPASLLIILNVTMNILESQVEDLNYLAESPIAGAVIDMNGQKSPESPAENSTPADNSGPHRGMKRKGASDDISTNGNTPGATPHTRAKRNRYISIAWYV